jgi:hypothetical protein
MGREARGRTMGKAAGCCCFGFELLAWFSVPAEPFLTSSTLWEPPPIDRATMALPAAVLSVVAALLCMPTASRGQVCALRNGQPGAVLLPAAAVPQCRHSRAAVPTPPPPALDFRLLEAWISPSLRLAMTQRSTPVME